MSASRRRMAGAAIGLVADRLLGEPPSPLHPVARFGAVMRVVERHVYGDTRGAGSAHAALGVAGAVLAGGALPTALATYIAVAGCSLRETAGAVGAALADGRLDEARCLLPALVGRQTAGLDEKEMARAVVESLAENTVDAVVAPALWAALAGGPGAWGYRAVNTLDAMVGHRSRRYERFGWASARLDDAANFIPARVTAALVAAVRPGRARLVWTVVRRDAARHPSPNGGVAEAAFAAALGLRLGGANIYGGRVEVRPSLGEGRPPEPSDIAPASALSRDVETALTVLLAAAAAPRWRR